MEARQSIAPSVRRLCVGIAACGDADRVWATVGSILISHPGLAPEIEFVVVDCAPGGSASGRLAAMADRVPLLRYVPFQGADHTPARNVVFREAMSEVVCCIDAGVLLGSGALDAVLAWFAEHPTSRDLLGGPCVGGDGTSVVATHLLPGWRGLGYGIEATDTRGEDPAGAAFEVALVALDVFACRAVAWPGLDARLHGLRGEEGFLHRSFALRGGRSVCLPALRWMAADATGTGPPDAREWVRNQRVGWRSVGADPAALEAHVRSEIVPPGRAERLLTATAADVAGPFDYFDGIFGLNLDSREDLWLEAVRRYRRLRIDWRVERFSAVPTPANHHIGCARSWRAMIAEASERDYETMLGFEDDAIFLDDTLGVLRAALPQLEGLEWDLLYLGGALHGEPVDVIPGRPALRRCRWICCAHAVVVHRRAYGRLLTAIPGDAPGFRRWYRKWEAIDQYLAAKIESKELTALLIWPQVAAQAGLLGEDPYKEWAPERRYS